MLVCIKKKLSQNKFSLLSIYMKIYLVKIWDLTESKKIVGDMPGISMY